MQKRKPFRQTSDQKCDQARILLASHAFCIPVTTRETAISMLMSDEAKLDVKNRRIILAFDLNDSLPGR